MNRLSIHYSQRLVGKGYWVEEGAIFVIDYNNIVIDYNRFVKLNRQ